MSKRMPRFQWRSAYDEERDVLEGAQAGVEGGGPVDFPVEQHHAAHVDINELARRYRIGELPPPEPLPLSAYMDLTNAPDLRTILDRSREAEELFMQFPAGLRRRFHDSSAEMVDFVMDPENAEEAVKLGLLVREKPPETPEPMRVTIVQPEGSEEPSSAASPKGDK